MKLDAIVKPTSNPEEWILLKALSYREVTVPVGFVTDGASVPSMLRFGRFKAGGSKFPAAVIHDFMYRNGVGTRALADLYFYEIMLLNGEPRFTAWLMYRVVRLFGRGEYP